jgi:hypothetical protein
VKESVLEKRMLRETVGHKEQEVGGNFLKRFYRIFTLLDVKYTILSLWGLHTFFVVYFISSCSRANYSQVSKNTKTKNIY